MAGSLDDPVLGNSALDRLANTSYQVVIEGSSYRERMSPHRSLFGPQTQNLSLSTGRPSDPMAAAMSGVKTLVIDRLSSEANRVVYVASSRSDLVWIPVAPSGLGGPSSSICGVPSASTQRTWKSWRPSSNGQS